MPKLALVLGATGGVGGATVISLQRHGWRVRALTRDVGRARRDFSALGAVEWVAGDAIDPGASAAASDGVQLILHGANPSGYRNWRGLALPMLANSIMAAKLSGARLILPGNIYNFGRDIGACVDENAPQNPSTRKGAVRVEMERMLAQAAEHGIRTLIIRAGDYFGPGAPSSWFQNVLVRPGRPVRRVVYPGPPSIGHAWAYLPDLAEAIARLAAIDGKLAACETVHFSGHWLEQGNEIITSIRRVVGRPDLPIRRFPWAVLALASPVVPLFLELLEMRYLWRQPLRLNNRKLVKLIGEEPHTPLDEAIGFTLAGLNCLLWEQSGGVAAPPRTHNVTALAQADSAI